MQTNVENLGGVQVISLSGRLDLSVSDELQGSVRQLIDGGGKRIVFDCSELSYVSSSGLGVFVQAAKWLKPEGGKVVFAALNQHVRRVFEMVGLFMLFEARPTRQEAVEAALE